MSGAAWPASYTRSPGAADALAHQVRRAGWHVWWVRTNAAGFWEVHAQRSANRPMEVIYTEAHFAWLTGQPAPCFHFGDDLTFGLTRAQQPKNEVAP